MSPELIHSNTNQLSCKYIRECGRCSTVRLRPVLPTASPLFGEVQHGEIQHIEQAVICRENSLGFSHLTQLPIEALYGIGRINQPPSSSGNLKYVLRFARFSLQDFEILGYFLSQISASTDFLPSRLTPITM